MTSNNFALFITHMFRSNKSLKSLTIYSNPLEPNLCNSRNHSRENMCLDSLKWHTHPPGHKNNEPTLWYFAHYLFHFLSISLYVIHVELNEKFNKNYIYSTFP